MSTSDAEAKAAIRRVALEARQSLTDGAERSALIGARLRELDEYRRARTISWYVGVRDEVATLPMIAQAVAEARRAAVPMRVGDSLELFEIRDESDFAPASFGLLEPRAAIRTDPSRQVGPHEVDLYVVPGVAFDRHGGRLGFGRGFYDRLLPLARPDAVLVGLAFDVQLVERLPLLPHDVRMHRVLTESATYAPEA